MDKSTKTSWQKKMQIKNDKKIVKLYEQEIKDAKQQEIEVYVDKPLVLWHRKALNTNESLFCLNWLLFLCRVLLMICWFCVKF